MSRLERAYRGVAAFALNTLILLAGINLGAYYWLSFQAKSDAGEDNPVISQYGEGNLKTAYPDLNLDEMRELLNETWRKQRYQYEPYTQYREKDFSGKYVNITEAGFRKVEDQGPWPPRTEDFVVFVFGGSTTFGYGQPDNQTIPSHLQGILRKNMGKPVSVYNFGRGAYISTQERILFENLLMVGCRPQIALFIDGLNDFYFYDGAPTFTKRLQDIFDQPTRSRSETDGMRWDAMPVLRAIKVMTGDRAYGGTAPPDKEVVPQPIDLQRAADRYYENTRMIKSIGQSYGVYCYFFIQPIPTYKYDLRYHLFGAGGFERHINSKHGYEMLTNDWSVRANSAEYLWGADLQLNKEKPLYVDKVHYTAEFSREIAAFIGNKLSESWAGLPHIGKD